MIFITEALRHRFQVSDSRLFPGALKSLQNTLPAKLNPGDSAAPRTFHKTHGHRPTLTPPGSNYGLSHTECRAEFPSLFDELDRSAALRRRLGNVSIADIDLSWKPSGAVRAMIFNQQVISFACLLKPFTETGADDFGLSSMLSNQNSTEKVIKDPAFLLLSTRSTVP